MFRWPPFAHEAGSKGTILLGFPIGTGAAEGEILEAVLNDAEVGSRRSTDGSRKSEIGDQLTQVGSKLAEVGNQKSEIRR